MQQDAAKPPALDPQKPTAVFFVGKNRGVSMHALLWVQRMFPDHFKNFVFLSVGEVDAQSYDGQGAMRTCATKSRTRCAITSTSATATGSPRNRTSRSAPIRSKS